VAAWDQALELDGGLENGRVMQAEGLIRLGRLERARTRLEEELTVHPESHVAWLNRGFLHLLEDNLEEARAAWSRCGGSPESRALLGLCGVLMAPNGVSMSDLMVLPIARAWGSAIDLMLRSEVTAPVQLILDWLDRTPQVDASWHAAVAHVLLERGYAQESLQRFLAARALKSDDAGIYVGLGEACAALDLKEDAIVMFQQACALAPHAPHPRRRLAQLQA
jgi:Flp pilus assembly protein TadD